jgi:hypothetical protein
LLEWKRQSGASDIRLHLEGKCIYTIIDTIGSIAR